MTKKNNQNNNSLKLILFSLFFVTIFTSVSFAQTNHIKSTDFEFDKFLSVNYDDNSIAKLNGIKIKTYLVSVYLNTVYDYGKNELGLSLTSILLNDYLGDGMKLELQTTPNADSGMIMFTLSF